MGTAPLSVRVVTQLAGGGAPPSNSCHRPRQLSGLPRRRGPYSNHLHPGGIRIFRIFHKQTKTSSYQEQCSWHWFGELATTHAWGSRWGNHPAQGLPLYMQCLREIFLLSFDSETTFFWIRVYTLPILDSAMRLEKAAPPRTPEQLAELGKYSGRSLQAG